MTGEEWRPCQRPAFAAIEAFCRQLAMEVGPHDIRVGLPAVGRFADAPSVDAAWRILRHVA
jgi:NAD(P)-dependent dehydrogenase (short-subunit alcohol dehydrogenase family)